MSSPLVDPRQFPDATDLAAAIRTGARSAATVVEEHVERIERFSDRLNAATTVFGETAWEKAQERAERGGPLAGVPISVKETYGIKGEPVTAGSMRATTYVPSADAVAVRRLKKGGAVVVARGNLPEFAMTHETVNLRFGRTNNPLAPDRIPGGSSGGDAALVASGGAAIGMGSDLGGSIRYPAHCCGIVGFKPTSGSVDPDGTWPPRDADAPELFADTMMSLGPLTRSVRDARLVYDVVADEPIADSAVDTPRILIADAFDVEIRDEEIRGARANAQHALEEAGATIEPVDALPDAGRVYEDFLKVIIRDYLRFFWKGLEADDGSGLSVPGELFRQATGRPSVHWHFFRLLLGMQVTRPSNQEATSSQSRLIRDRRTVRDRLGDDGLLLLPTNGALAMKHGRAASYMARPGVRRLFTPTIFMNAMNLPAITIPVWSNRDRATGLVPGVQLACAPGAEDLLFRTAERLETALRTAATVTEERGSTISSSLQS
jgi:aspartyl-tRNA(Asn)/glutamyl-tRNA(Gln) amidotransferase subunit A/fatty acid amide hydrolase 2